MNIIVSEIAKVDNELSKMLVMNCVYRNGLCGEPKPCGQIIKNMEKYYYYRQLFGGYCGTSGY